MSDPAELPEKLTERQLLTRAQRREREAKAALAHLQLKIELGEYLPKDDVRARDLQRIAVVKSGLLGLPKSIAGAISSVTGNSLHAAEIEALIDARVRDLLRRFGGM